MAFKAQQVHVTALQQPRIRGTMGSVAGYAALSLHRSVLPGEGACFVGVAGEADHVLRGGGTQLVRQKSAVGVVATLAAHQALVDLVVKRLGEIGFHFQVTGVAKRWGRGAQQFLLNLGMVYGVAIHATHIVLHVLGAQEVGMLFAKLVAPQATLRRLFARQAGKADDLIRIGGLGMGFSRPVTGLATLPLRPLVLGHRSLPVGAPVEAFAHIFVAGFTGVRSDIL